MELLNSCFAETFSTAPHQEIKSPSPSSLSPLFCSSDDASVNGMTTENTRSKVLPLPTKSGSDIGTDTKRAILASILAPILAAIPRRPPHWQSWHRHWNPLFYLQASPSRLIRMCSQMCSRMRSRRCAAGDVQPDVQPDVLSGGWMCIRHRRD